MSNWVEVGGQFPLYKLNKAKARIPTLRKRRGMVNEILVLIIGLVVASILLGTIFLTGLGTLANGTKGTACVNCQASTKTLLNNTELILVLSVFIAIIFGALAIAKVRGK